jgi:HSP20 family protein
MGIMDKITALLPRRREEREEQPSPRGDALALRDDVDRWLQRLIEEPWGFGTVSDIEWMPVANLHETDDEAVVSVEVPGLHPDDLDLRITPGGLTIRGEKREEREDKRQDFHLTERRYGSFVRTVPLPSGVDVDRAEARFKNGVLTVRFPKTASRAGTRRVPIKT